MCNIIITLSLWSKSSKQSHSDMIITIFAPTIWVYCVFTAPIIPCQFLKIPLQIVEDKGAKLRRKAVIIIIRDQVYVSSGLIICSNKTCPEQESILQLRISTVQRLLNDHQFIQAARVGIQRASKDQWFFWFWRQGLPWFPLTELVYIQCLNHRSTCWFRVPCL